MTTKTIYTLVPLLTLAGFGLAYKSWAANEAAAAKTTCVNELKVREETISDHYRGKEYIGRDGKKEAQADLAGHTPKYYIYGLRAQTDHALAQIMRDRFGIEWKPIAGCVVSEPLVRFADSYNEEIDLFVAKRYGPSALAQAQKDAQTQWEEQRRKAGKE